MWVSVFGADLNGDNAKLNEGLILRTPPTPRHALRRQEEKRARGKARRAGCASKLQLPAAPARAPAGEGRCPGPAPAPPAGALPQAGHARRRRLFRFPSGPARRHCRRLSASPPGARGFGCRPAYARRGRAPGRLASRSPRAGACPGRLRSPPGVRTRRLAGAGTSRRPGSIIILNHVR